MKNPERPLENPEAAYLEIIRGQQAVITALTKALISERQAHAETRARARHDPDIPTMLNKAETERAIESHIEGQSQFGLFLIDFDHFKDINDTLGHPKGDDILRRFGELLNESFKRETDEIARLIEQGRTGGDEFMLLISLGALGGRRTGKWTTQMDSAYEKIKEIGQTLRREYPEVAALGFDLSVGGAWFDPELPMTGRELRNQADEAMYEEKPEDSR